MSKQKVAETEIVVEASSTSPSLSIKDKVGDAANNWLARNRSLVLRQTPVWAQSLTLILSGLGSIAVLGSIFFRIDEVVTVQGQLKSIGGTVAVKSPAGGRVSELFFKDGEIVQKGDLLLRFDTRQAAFDKKTLKNQITLENAQLDAQSKILESQVATLISRKQVLQKRLDTKKAILSEMRVLVQSGGFQRIQYLEQQDSVFAMEKQLSEINEQIIRIQIETERIKLESKKSVGAMQGQLNTANLQLQYRNVVAPVTGVIFDPQASQESVINSGQRILSIVPQEGLYAEVYVPNKDIGFVKMKQEAKVRVDAFPFSRYGEIPAEIRQIGADALPPDGISPFYRFPVKLRLETPTLESNGVSIPLKPGMAITTNLKLRDKSDQFNK